MNPEPPPFGDPTNINRENAAAVRKGVAVGCGGCFAVVVLGLGLMASLFFIVEIFLRGSDVGKETMKRAQQSPAMQQALGEPMKMGWLVFGSIHVENDSGGANLSIPISGPLGACSVKTVAEKKAGIWEYSRMKATLPSGESIDLLQTLKETSDSGR